MIYGLSSGVAEIEKLSDNTNKFKQVVLLKMADLQGRLPAGRDSSDLRNGVGTSSPHRSAFA